MQWIEQLQLANWREGSCVFLGAYILGCFTTGYYLVRWRKGKDIREMGSGNLGAKNVGRILGWAGFLATVLGDSGKGALAVWAAQRVTHDDQLAALAMVAVVAGHIWPAQLWFGGGKGVATSMGALLVLDFRLAAALVILFTIFLLVFRKWVLPGLAAFAALPLISLSLGQEPSRVVLTALLAGLVLMAHRKNLFEKFCQFVERPTLQTKHQPPEL